MARSIRQRSSRPAVQRATVVARRGLVQVTLLVATSAVLLATLSLALSLAVVTHRQCQLQAACDAAALAGAAELLDRSVLSPESPGERQVAGSQTDEALPDDQIAAARIQAQRFALRNRAGGSSIRLDANKLNWPDGDIVVGWVEDPTSPVCEMILSRGRRVNSLLVRASQTRQRGNPVTAWFGGLVGLTAIDLVVSARATIDQRIYGFRPAGHVRVPAVPIMVSSAQRNGWLQQTDANADVHVNDRYAVDARMGTCFRGSDGILEVKVRLGPTREGEARENAFLFYTNGRLRESGQLSEQIVFGFGPHHLERLGGELALGSHGELLLEGTPSPTRYLLDQMRSSLLAIQGQERIWPLGTREGVSSCRVTGFAAGRIVDCVTDSSGVLEAVVQPCVLQTCTALTSSGQPLNRWLGKLVLTQ